MDPIEPENGVIERRWLEIGAGAGLLLLLVLGCLKVVLPFISPILWAVVLCLSTWPLYEHLRNRLHRNWLAALVMTLSLAVVAIAPFAIAFRSLSEQAKVFSKTVADEIDHWPPPLPQWVADLPAVGPRIKSYWQESNPVSGVERSAEAGQIMATLRSATVRVVRAIGRGILQTSLSMLVGFFIYRDGETLAGRLRTVMTRIAGAKRGPRLLQLAHATIVGVIFGILGTALLQGLVAEIGFWITGVPGAFLLAFLTFAISIIPFGPTFIWATAVLWLLHQGNRGSAVFLLLWSILGHGAVEAFIKPLLISRSGGLPLVVVLIGVLGGATAFGFVGVFLGPTLLAVGYKWLDEWSAEISVLP